MKHKNFIRHVALAMSILMFFSSVSAVYAASIKSTGISKKVLAAGIYSNWEGVSTVSQFTDEKGNYCFAYDSKKYVTVVKTENGKPLKKKIKLMKENPLFGGVICDAEGNFYLACGKENKSSDYTKNTIFISKYDSSGKHIKTVGDNGSSSCRYYGKNFNTQCPFDSGNCALAINGNYLAVNYARLMHSGHQSNSVFMIDIQTMEEVYPGEIYSSHSFAQRAQAYKNSFLFASEGDCYSRAFTISKPNYLENEGVLEEDIFHFWVKKNTLAKYDMATLNDNFAHMGDLVIVGDNAALVATSVKALSSKASSQTEQLFIQIFDPTKELDEESAYVTSGTRSGKSGPNGTINVTDYGVKWLTSYSKKYEISNPQAVADEDGNIVILYELYKSYRYLGVYYMRLDAEGQIVTPSKKYSAEAKLNPCETPVCTGGRVWWTANKTKGNKMYIYSLAVLDK